MLKHILKTYRFLESLSFKKFDNTRILKSITKVEMLAFKRSVVLQFLLALL